MQKGRCAVSQIYRLRVIDAIKPNREYTFTDIARAVELPEPILRKAIRTLWRNKALRIIRRRPYTYQRTSP